MSGFVSRSLYTRAWNTWIAPSSDEDAKSGYVGWNATERRARVWYLWRGRVSVCGGWGGAMPMTGYGEEGKWGGRRGREGKGYCMNPGEDVEAHGSRGNGSRQRVAKRQRTDYVPKDFVWLVAQLEVEPAQLAVVAADDEVLARGVHVHA